MDLKLFLLFGFVAAISGAEYRNEFDEDLLKRAYHPQVRRMFRENGYNENYFRRSKELKGGCSQAALDFLASTGVDVEKSTGIDCSHLSMRRGMEKRECQHIYTPESACCSPGCNWFMESMCMNPTQMLCNK